MGTVGSGAIESNEVEPTGGGKNDLADAPKRHAREEAIQDGNLRRSHDWPVPDEEREFISLGVSRGARGGKGKEGRESSVAKGGIAQPDARGKAGRQLTRS